MAGVARRLDKMQQLAERVHDKPGEFHPFQLDVTIEEDIIQTFKHIANTLGPIHVLVNNAGIGQPTTLVGGNAEMWKKVFDTNVLSLCMTTREAIEDMKRSGVDGHVIHINSVLGHHVLQIPRLNVYPASKFAVTALTETLRRELMDLGSKIKVTVKKDLHYEKNTISALAILQFSIQD